MMKSTEMKKNPSENLTTIEIDPVSGEYYINLPQWMLDERGWYEGTEINLEFDNDYIMITEINNN
jgi:hypothetical protein